MVQDCGMAEDIAQEVFITVYRSIGSFNERSSISTWIYRITVNKCLDHLRSQTRKKKGGLMNLGDNIDENKAVVFDHPGIKLEQKENARYLFDAINDLPENQKTAFILSHIEELPQKEIAEIMDISLKAVESLLQRAKANLRKKLESVYERRKNN